jgi:hypothetical protein
MVGNLQKSRLCPSCLKSKRCAAGSRLSLDVELSAPDAKNAAAARFWCSQPDRR